MGHVIRLDDDRIPKQLLYGELYVGSHPQHKPKKRFKDCVKDSLALSKIDDPDWEMVACDRYRWKKMVYSGSRCFQDNANIWAKTKRAARKGDNIDPDLSQFVCKECGRVCLSSAGLISHWRSHAGRPLANYESHLGINQLAFEECGKVCKSRSDLARHLKIHQALENTRERHNQKILFAVSVGEYASHLLVSKVTAGLMTDNNNPKSAMVMLV